ncbi:hypothetical protein KFZ56_15585 [Virgibacillus sp. NKC19-3]|uniref:hypothetical protein n=1 Tax=Virgibacillus saliphilus TaxID=2831674 RepID=UPI001C9B70A9|nr:hypothetical protein [Virgibacillus sp. NKC19-3]MBY7144445.1 hypothetical protein [Virgibacillus sp. NKC19-3]
MKEKVLTQAINYEKEKIESSFKKLYSGSTFFADRIIYYPYYYFIYSVNAKRIFMPMEEKMGCVVDAISCKGSLIDSNPKLEVIDIPSGQILEKSQSLDNCLSTSEAFIHRSLSLKMRMISFSNITLEKQALFYRPYWIVFHNNEKQNEHNFIVDGVTGQYHPL